MKEETAGAIRVASRPGPFGPVRQSFEITNDSKRAVTVYLERSGSEYFRIRESGQKLVVKAGRSVRAEVEFAPPAPGMIMTSSATYRAAITVWRADQDGATKALVDIVNLTGVGPGFVSPADLRCFEPEESLAPQKSARRSR